MAGTERDRLADTGPFANGLEAANAWYLWGPYLAERAWGTVREDYGAACSGWNGVSHDAARSKAFRWNEEGLAGICDAEQRLCLAVALWNGVDPILKERCFGLTNDEGNHGEDVKEYWWYRDAVPSGAWLSWRYHYPQTAFPYRWLREESLRRRAAGGGLEPELLDAGAFDDDRYWVIDVDYAKADVDDILVRIRATNASAETASLHLLPTLWFRNTWSWTPGTPRPDITVDGDALVAVHPAVPRYRLAAAPAGGVPPGAVFCDNDSNDRRLYRTDSGPAYPKDGINDHVIRGLPTINPSRHGTKASWWYRLSAGAGQTVEIRLRLSADKPAPTDRPALAGAGPGAGDGAAWSGSSFDELMTRRRREADEFYAELTPADATADEAAVMRQAFAGLLWSKQYYPYDVALWLDGDPGQPAPPPDRRHHPPGRNLDWRHLRSADVFCMPDTWEYPWFAAWDLAFHAVVLAHVDPAFAKHQLRLLCLDRFQQPEGDLPAYEWEFSDLNPPVHAWAAMKVYRLDGSRDRRFLTQIFDRLHSNFAWWLRQEDRDGNNLFSGGFLGLDNVVPFSRSNPPAGIELDQADATAWMAFYSLSMLHIASELAVADPAYEPYTQTYLDHFGAIAHALTTLGLWDAQDGFFYDRIHQADGQQTLIKMHSIVGVIPLFAVAVVPDQQLDHSPPGLPDARGNRLGSLRHAPEPGRSLLTVVTEEQLTTVLRTVLDERELLSPYGIRSLSRQQRTTATNAWTADYQPAEADIGSVNSNWCGPVWFPVNYLLIEALGRLGTYYGDRVRVEFPTGSGQPVDLVHVAAELRRRLISLFVPGPDGRRPSYGWVERFQHDERWRANVLFFEYFHGDNGAGLGASHQTGWTALVADLITGRRLGGEGESW